MVTEKASFAVYFDTLDIKIIWCILCPADSNGLKLKTTHLGHDCGSPGKPDCAADEFLHTCPGKARIAPP
jgi:hypothetical protein